MAARRRSKTSGGRARRSRSRRQVTPQRKANKVRERIMLGALLKVASIVLGPEFAGESEGFWSDFSSIMQGDLEDDIFPESMRKAYVASVESTCQLCGRRYADGWVLHCHHLFLRCLGGRHTFGNMACFCVLCHYRVHKFLEFLRIGLTSSNRLKGWLKRDRYKKTSWDGFWIIRVWRYRSSIHKARKAAAAWA